MKTFLLAGTMLAAFATAAAAQPTLTGFASLPADTFLPGPTSGQFSGARNAPFVDKQPVQGFSGILPGSAIPGAAADSYWVMQDNGFGAKANSADSLLRVYNLTPNFKTAAGGTANVTVNSQITLSDPNHKVNFAIQADFTNYYNNASNPAVDSGIKNNRLLTGADFDIESFRRSADNTLWFGEEFGPYLLHTDLQGHVLDAPIALPNAAGPNPIVQSPSNPLPQGADNLGNSRGFEGMGQSADGTKLYTLLEGTVTGDPAGALRINEFDTVSKSYTGKEWLYKLDAAGTNIGDMTQINDHEFVVLERDNTTGAGAIFKKVFLIDIDKIDANGFVSKEEIADLMNIADPNDLNGDGSSVFTFPFVTIEDILPLDAYTLLIVNDNNYPFDVGTRAPGLLEASEFITIRLDRGLGVPEPGMIGLFGLGAAGLLRLRRRA